MTSHVIRPMALLMGLLFIGLMMAADRAPIRGGNSSAADQVANVDMFDALQAKQLEVKLIPKDETESSVMITNKTKKPLSVKLPDAFAGVPVLAQALAGAGGNRPGGTGGVAAQPVGGGMGGMGGGMGMGMMNIPPEQVRKFKVTTVCLEHGKRPPRPGIPYEMRPIEDYTSDPQIQELLKLFGQGGISQRAAQAAAWHLANHMSWDQLASKQVEHLGADSEPYFTADEIRAGETLADRAVARAKEMYPDGYSAGSRDK